MSRPTHVPKLVSVPDLRGNIHHMAPSQLRWRPGAYGTLVGIKDGERRALVVSNLYHDKYALVGGGYDDLGELSPAVMLREAAEECGLPVRIVRPFYFHEHFVYFNPGGATPDEAWHVIGLCYMLELLTDAGTTPPPTSRDVDEGPAIWVPLTALTRENTLGGTYDAYRLDPRSMGLLAP